MKLVVTIALVLFSTVLMGQSWRGIYHKKSCFCDNHSNSKGWYLGAGVYGSQLSFQNEFIDGKTTAFGYGGFIGNKIKEQYSFRLGVYFGKVQRISIGEGNRDFPSIDYRFKHLNIPLSLVYKFRSEKRISPYLTLGGEANIVREIVVESDFLTIFQEEETGYNQFNVVLGAGSYILFGDHFGLFVQGTIDMNPFTNTSLSNYNYAFTGKTGLTYHF